MLPAKSGRVGGRCIKGNLRPGGRFGASGIHPVSGKRQTKPDRKDKVDKNKEKDKFFK